ncbi:MAG: hypothetical protein RMI90_10400, partial [Thermoguttaceae bacterium]|nr:hypothetical protein [Thermoguttaceae bacterium]
VGKDQPQKPVEEIYEAFLKYPNLPILKHRQVLVDAILQGVRDGLFGVKIGDQTFFQTTPGQVGPDALLVRHPQTAPKTSPPPPTPAAQQPPPPPAQQMPPPTPHDTSPVRTIHTYTLRAAIPWDRLSAVVHGVLSPLKQDGAELTIELRLHAHSPLGIKLSTLEHKVRETLRQINAQIFEQTED